MQTLNKKQLSSVHAGTVGQDLAQVVIEAGITGWVGAALGHPVGIWSAVGAVSGLGKIALKILTQGPYYK